MKQREIKFRIVHKNKIVGYERLGENGWEWNWLELNADEGERWVKGGVIQDSTPQAMIRNQYTGINDRNGKEIYEGDKIKFNLPKNNYWSSEIDQSPIGGIRFESDHGGYIVEFRESGFRQNYVKLNCDIAFECKIIGNLFENPDLL